MRRTLRHGEDRPGLIVPLTETNQAISQGELFQIAKAFTRILDADFAKGYNIDKKDKHAFCRKA